MERTHRWVIMNEKGEYFAGMKGRSGVHFDQETLPSFSISLSLFTRLFSSEQEADSYNRRNSVGGYVKRVFVVDDE